MKKKIIQRFLSSVLVASLLCGMCGCSSNTADTANESANTSSTETTSSADANSDNSQTSDAQSEMPEVFERPAFLTVSTKESKVEANIPKYDVKKDLSNITNADRYYFDQEQIELLRQNLFFVNGDYGSDEFFEEYETNRYLQKPNFVTVDSLMHTYHLYFSYLLKTLEKEHLADNLSDVSESMLEQTSKQYETLKGTEWEDAAKNNLAFFTIGAYLQNSSTKIPKDVQDIVEEELSRIFAANGTETSLITGTYEDYTQYIPRGYYEGDSKLEEYFRAMMWYGRTPFTQENEKSNQSALLITLALRDGEFKAWEAAYTVTSFFAGASDDLGYYEYLPAIEMAYGSDVTAGSLSGNANSWKQYQDIIARLEGPKIYSIPVEDTPDKDVAVKSFRFMGQRFTIDATIMQNLVYSSVEANPSGDTRMLPDTLDVAAVLGSSAAENLLEQKGDMEFKGFKENLETLKNAFNKAPEELWTASLYADWLNTLTPLLKETPNGYPSYKLNDAWKLKKLETFAGSYAELKHDTILYSKQVVAEMGGDDDMKFDDRGYVDPEIEVYDRFTNLATATIEGLRTYDLLTKSDEKNLTRLQQLAKQLSNISRKELENQKLSDEEYELIRNYGGNLEHFWKEATRGLTDDENATSSDYPAPIIADIATDPNGQVLEIGTGRAQTIYVVVPVDGKLRIASGSVYNFYQFAWPQSDRLTDSKWRKIMGFVYDGSGDFVDDPPIDIPAWTDSYRYHYNYEY